MWIEGVEFTSEDFMKLSPEQQQIAKMLITENELPKNIATRRQTTLSAVYKTITKLRKKGIIKRGVMRGLKNSGMGNKIQPPTKQLQQGIRLHAQKFTAKLLYQSPAYGQLRQNKNIFFIDGNTITLHRNSLRIFSRKGLDFWGADCIRATALSMDYWNKIFQRLEDKLRVIIIKGENTRIKQFDAHYSEVNNEIAEGYVKKKVKIKLFAREDGKLWFEIDNSWNFKEAEFKHPETAEDDGSHIKAILDQYRHNDVMTPLEMQGCLSGALKAVSAFGEYGIHIKSHIKVLSAMEKTQSQLNNSIAELTRIIKNMRR